MTTFPIASLPPLGGGTTGCGHVASSLGCISAVVSVSLVVSISAATLNFNDSKIGQIPAGWQSGVTGDGRSHWSVETENTAPSQPNVLKQSAVGTFPWCVYQQVSLTDGFVETKFKPLSGKEDRAGGVIWRWKNAEMFYVARANALEDNVAIYHTIGSRRTTLKSVDVKVTASEWHTLRVDFHGSRFVVSFDGKPVIQIDNEKIRGAGLMGLWTKEDSVTAFDDFSYGAP